MFKRLLVQLLIIVCLLLLGLTTQLYAKEQRHLVVLNWTEYLAPELIEKFETEFNIKVIQVYFTSEENRTEKLLENNGYGYDIIVSSAIDIGRYVKRGWLKSLNEEEIPNLKYIDISWRQGYAGAEKYAAPFARGTTGIVYRADLVKEPITSWQQFYQPVPELQGKISMTGDSQDYISMGLKSLGYSANSENLEQLKHVEHLLLSQKKHLRSHEYISVEADSAIVKGDVVASMIYNSDALMVKEHNENLTFVLPKEGGGLWIDSFVISAYAKNYASACDFLNFFNRPKNAALQSMYSYSAPANVEAVKLLPADFIDNPVIYPTAAELKNSEFYLPLSPQGQRQRNAIAARVLR